jgi:hypothetical protein
LKLNIKIGIVGIVAAALIGFAVFGLGHSTEVRADVTAGNVWILPQHSTVTGPSCGSASRTAGADSTTGGWMVNTTNFPPSVGSFFLNTGTSVASPTGLPLVEILNTSAASSIFNGTNPALNNQAFIFICVNTTGTVSAGVNSGSINYNTAGGAAACTGAALPAGIGSCLNDGDLVFSAIVQSNMGFFDQAGCSDRNANNVFGEFSTSGGSDNCVFQDGSSLTGGTAELEIPSVSNNLNTVIVRFNCQQNPLASGLVMPLTIQQDAGSFIFNVICKGQASATATTISATPNTVEIIPARSNTSHSLILMKIADSNGNPIFPGQDVQFTTDRCSIETAGLGTGTSALTTVTGAQLTNGPSLGTLADGPSVLSVGAAVAMTSALNAAAPGTFLTWEFSAAAQTLPDVLGGFAPFGTFSFTPQADSTKSIDGFDLNGNGVPDFSLAAAILSCNPVQAPGVTPGVANIAGCVAVLNALDVCVTTSVKVIGPPASITVAASPTSVNCGEKSTVTATVVDAIGQSVSDHTRVEFVTNLGGVIGGTGAVAGFAANVAPVSSSVADTFGGVATAFLITSDVTSGPYEVVATSGGTTAGDFGSTINLNGVAGNPLQTYTYNQLLTPIALAGGAYNGAYSAIPVTTTYLGGQFSTPPVSAQVTVNCALPVVAAPAAPAPVIVAPRTGTGITPPNTGDAGLLGSSSSSSSSSWTLVALGGVFALTFAGMAAAKAARR